MSVARYAKVLLLSPTTGSLIACSAGIVVCGLMVTRLAHHHSQANSVPAQARAEQSPMTVKPTASLLSLTLSYSPPELEREPHRAAAEIFHSRPHGAELESLRHYAAGTTQDAIRSKEFRSIVDSQVPYAPFHFGIDVPLPKAIKAILATSQQPVEIRSNRYLMLSAATESSAAGRGFLWIDLTSGQTIGGIFFHPSNGEPTPTLTLFSKQVTSDTVSVKQLPRAFLADLKRWSVDSEIPAVTTRYFVNGMNRKTVLRHEENLCTSDAQTCSRMKERATAIDTAAQNFLAPRRFAPNATMRMAVVALTSSDDSARAR